VAGMILFRCSDDGVFGHAEFFHHGVARGGNAETIDGDHFTLQTDIFPPQTADTCLDGDALGGVNGVSPWIRVFL